MAARRLIAVALAAAVGGSACGGSPGSDPTATPTSTTPAAAVSVPPPGDPACDGWAVWPEDTCRESSAALQAGSPEWRRDRAALAARFASEVLGWDDASTADYAGTVQCGDDGCLEVRSGDAEVLVVFRQLAEAAWAVRSVGALDGEDAPLGLSVTGSKVSAVFDLGGAASADLEVGYGDDEVTHTYTATDDAGWDLGFQPSGAGHYLLLFRDESGAVTSAQGSPLPEGDFAAG